MLASDGSDDKLVLLGTVENLHCLAEAESLFVDRTFSICPSIFYQVFSIMKQGQTFPMVFALLLNKLSGGRFSLRSCTVLYVVRPNS